MSEMQLVKHNGALRPAYQVDAEKLDKLKNDQILFANIKQPRNPQFHRKFFALLNLGFDFWEPDCRGVELGKLYPEKNFDRFRKDILILAGYRHAVVNIKNEVRYEADSISFAKMDETEFQDVYKNVFGVIWKLVLSYKFESEQEAENAVDQMMSFS